MISATAPAPVDPPDPALAAAARARLSTLEGGKAALGELADLAVWATSVRGVCPPTPFSRPRALLLAADHGVARSDSLPRALAADEGAGPQALLVHAAGITAKVVNVGLDLDPDAAPAGLDHRPVRRRSGAIDRADALTLEQVHAAVATGRQLVDEEVDSGTDLLIPAAIGVDARLPATAMIATLTRTEPIWALGFGAIADDAEWSRWCQVIRDARRRTRDHGNDPHLLLSKIGGADLAVLTGILLQAAVRRTPVLLDGTVGAAAGLLTRELAPDAPAWWLAPQRNGAAAERTALEMLQLSPTVSLELRLGEGCGALASVPLLVMAVSVLAELSSEPPAGLTVPHVELDDDGLSYFDAPHGGVPDDGASVEAASVEAGAGAGADSAPDEADGDSLVPGEPVAASDEPVAASGGAAGVPGEPVAAPGGTAPVPAPGEPVAAPGGAGAVPDEAAGVPGRAARSSEDAEVEPAPRTDA